MMASLTEQDGVLKGKYGWRSQARAWPGNALSV